MGLTISATDPRIRSSRQWITAISEAIGIPTLQDLNISREQIIGCTNYVANEGLRFLCPVPATEERIAASPRFTTVISKSIYKI